MHCLVFTVPGVVQVRRLAQTYLVKRHDGPTGDERVRIAQWWARLRYAGCPWLLSCPKYVSAERFSWRESTTMWLIVPIPAVALAGAADRELRPAPPTATTMTTSVLIQVRVPDPRTLEIEP